MATPNTTGSVLEVDGTRNGGDSTNNGRHKLTACAAYIHKDRDAKETIRDTLDGTTSP